MRDFKRFLSGECGATAAEYALLLGVIIIVSVATLGGFGKGVDNIYTVIDNGLPNP